MRASTPRSSPISSRRWRSRGSAPSDEAATLRARADEIRAADRRRPAEAPRRTGATRPSARPSSASGASTRPGSTWRRRPRRRRTRGGWRRRRCSWARSRACAASTQRPRATRSRRWSAARSRRVRRAYTGKVGLALSGGGFRASLFHIGTLARLAECKVLRRVEVLSCVSGGSILGAYYYLKLRELLQSKPDAEITDADYVELVRELAEEFLDGRAGKPARTADRRTSPTTGGCSRRGTRGPIVPASCSRRCSSPRSPRDREDGPGAPWRMSDLLHHAPRTRGRVLAALRQLAARGQGADPRPQRDDAEHRAQLAVHGVVDGRAADWRRRAGRREPATARVYYRDAPEGHREPTLGKAVARLGVRARALPAGHPGEALRRRRRRRRRRARRRRRPRQPGHREPARAGLHRHPGQRRERTDARRRGPAARPARRREPVELGADEPRARGAVQRARGPAAIGHLARADGRPPDEGAAGAAARLEQVPGALSARGRRACARRRLRAAALRHRRGGAARALGAAHRPRCLLRRRGVLADGGRLRDDPSRALPGAAWPGAGRSRSRADGGVAVRAHPRKAEPARQREWLGPGSAAWAGALLQALYRMAPAPCTRDRREAGRAEERAACRPSRGWPRAGWAPSWSSRCG